MVIISQRQFDEGIDKYREYRYLIVYKNYKNEGSI